MSYLLVNDFFLEIAKGNIPKHSAVLKFGNNPNVGTIEEDIWSGGGKLEYLDAAETISIVSTSLDDTSTGVGARTIDVYGVDGSYDIAKETITLTGTTPAITTTAFLRIFRIKVLTAGSDHVNSGTIIATASVSNTTQAQVEIEQGQTLMALYTVPAGQTAYMHRFYYSINKKTAISANIRLFVKPFGGAWNLKSLLGAGSTGDNSDDRDFKIPMPIAEKTDIRMTAIANVTGGDISAGYDMVLVEN